MKNIILLLCFFFSYQISSAQSNFSKLTGSITDSTGTPVTYATIALLNTNKGTTTDARGNFTISNLLPGTYNVVISAVGFQTQSQVVDIGAQETKDLSVSIKQASRLLNEVIVTSRRGDERKENLTSSITLINPRTIQELQNVSNNPADIMAVAVPGLAVSSGTSSNWGQSLRGRLVLVLVDVVPQSTPLRNWLDGHPGN